MAPKKASIGKKSSKLKNVKEKRANETADERELRLEKNRNRISTRINIETEEERESRLQQDRDKKSSSRATEKIQKRTQRLDANRNRMAQSQNK
ncbi:hypothetical protein EVAR_41113_1 [Eumeta japonica]|uniref:Uncharacterized protein n=1 Tax=Eumeta variegata TaxID=151549 RepID=A0A4C1XEB9_EUMVA|nr:hypothetical protein EVAR_41113_1 [Eumeta japonica]